MDTSCTIGSWQSGYAVCHELLLFRTLLKIKRACQLLLGTTVKINQISFKLGFEDPYYFSRIFSKIAGVPPKKYRETRKE